MKNQLYKNPWAWVFAVVLVTAVFFILNFNNITEENRIKREISEANYCKMASDCALVGSKCPFGCYIYVNKNEADRIKKLVDGYESKCVYSCIRSERVECIENKCQAQMDGPGTQEKDFILSSTTTITPGDWHEHRISPNHLIFTPEPVEEPVVGEYYAYGEHISISAAEYDKPPGPWIESFHDLDDVLVNEYEWGRTKSARTLMVDHEPAGADGDQITHYLFSDSRTYVSPRVYVFSYYRPGHMDEKSNGRVLFQKVVNEQKAKMDKQWEDRHQDETDRYIIDEDNVYFITEGGEEVLMEGADPLTFEILWRPVYEGCRKGTYSKDATDVFWKNERVEEADVETFEVLINEYGKDETHVYLRGEVQDDLDPDTFQPECNYG